MNEVTRPNHKNGGTVRPVTAETRAEVLFFQDLATFSQAVETATGVVFDFSSLTQLLTPFLGQPSDQYLIVNVKDCDGADPDNLLFLTQDDTHPHRQPLRYELRLYARAQCALGVPGRHNISNHAYGSRRLVILENWLALKP